MSAISIRADTFFPGYVPALDSATARPWDMKDVLPENSSSHSWTATQPARYKERIDLALEDAQRSGIRVLAAAVTLAEALGWILPTHVPLADVFAEEDGDIVFEWHESSRKNLTLTITPNGFIGYSRIQGLDTEYGHTPFSGSLPDVLVQNVLRMYPLRTSSRPL